MPLSLSYDPAFLRLQAQHEGDRRVRERVALVEEADTIDAQFFPLTGTSTPVNRIALIDESGHHFVVRNSAGEDTALVVSRCSYVLADSGEGLTYGPHNNTVFYPAAMSRVVADTNALCALTFGGRMPYNHADVADFGERVGTSSILELIAKNNLWSQVRSLWTTGLVQVGDIVLVDGTLNVVATPTTATVDEIDRDLHDSGVILAGLSKRFSPKCGDIVRLGRELYPQQPFIFTIPRERILAAHAGDEKNQMILTLGPRGRTLNLMFGIVLSTDPYDFNCHGLFISYRHNEPHRLAVEQALRKERDPVKVYDDSIPYTNDFIQDVLLPVGESLVQYCQGVVSPRYPLPAGEVHSHVLLTSADLQTLIQPMLAGILEGGEHFELVHRDQLNPHDVVDVQLNRFSRR